MSRKENLKIKAGERSRDIGGWLSVGVDLAGSRKNWTGLCKMNANLFCETSKVKMEEEIIQYILDADPEVIAVDAPLCMPPPNTHLRKCDRCLVEMGIHVLPPTLLGMKMLTKRAMNLKEKLLEVGYRVIEVYPTGSLKILGLPERKFGVEDLKKKLLEIGVRGLKREGLESVHEIDAVLCALTGIAYLTGKYIEIGSPEECTLILPSPDFLSYITRSLKT
ncbi:MAG: DUF429 domain-containing protein [Nitrososphaerota archaeon]